MPLFPRRVRWVALCALLAVGVSASSANAGLYPDLEIRWWVNGNFVASYFPVGTPGSDGWRYFGFETDLGTGLTCWSFTCTVTRILC